MTVSFLRLLVQLWEVQVLLLLSEGQGSTVLYMLNKSGTVKAVSTLVPAPMADQQQLIKAEAE